MPNPRKSSKAERELLRQIFSERICKLNNCIRKASSSMWPAIWSREIGRIEALFENLTGMKWGEEEEADAPPA